ncbi:MAG: T9SS type A sorting domain-containing protein, partial [Bacteroidales bacterium]
ITSLDLSNNSLLKVLECGNNPLLSLDVSANSELYYLKINDMPELEQVCVYSDPLPWMCCDMMTGIDTTGSPNVFINTECTENTLVDVEEGLAFSIYPNPTDQLVTIEIGTNDFCHLEIRSLSGRILFSERMKGNTFQIDLSPYPKGIYMISVRSNETVKTEKIIKL